jgi:hypothetical protein
MRNSLIIIRLVILRSASATQEPKPNSGTSLHGPGAICAEITVAYEGTDTVDDLSQTVAMNGEK